MRFTTYRRRLVSAALALAVGGSLAACFKGDDNGALTQDCSTVKTALERAKKGATKAQQKALSGGRNGTEIADKELDKVAKQLRKDTEDVEDEALKKAVDAAADDLENVFSGGTQPSPDGGFARLERTLKSKCSSEQDA